MFCILTCKRDVSGWIMKDYLRRWRYFMNPVFFDLDGVLTPKDHYIQLAELVGREEEICEISKKGISEIDRIGLEGIIREMARVFVDIPEFVLEDAGRSLPAMKGTKATIRELKEYGYNPILITGGIEQVAGAFAQRMGITEWYGNTLEIKNGITTGRLRTLPLARLQSKGDLVRKIIASGSSRRLSAAVGNDINDWTMFQEVGISILFNPSPNLKPLLEWCIHKRERGFTQECIGFSSSVDVVIEEPDLKLILPFLLLDSRIIVKS
jgi:HAD superfamily phosphoserine phosphatase-like hydrolase